jgi:hypothetical protein
MGTCKNLLTDPVNCGACGAFCQAGQSCQNGVCVKPVTTTIPTPTPVTCTSGYTKCSGTCVNLTSDSSNCGSCGHACPSGSYCFRSYCLNFCKLPYCDICNGVQTDLRYSQSNCGSCGHVCTGGTVCTQGQCL